MLYLMCSPLARHGNPACLLGSCVTSIAVFLWCRHEGARFQEGQGISAGQHACCMATARALAGIAIAQTVPCQSLQRSLLACAEGVRPPAGLVPSLPALPAATNACLARLCTYADFLKALVA